ncbi:MAG: M48 family metalloprotease [Methanobacterium sp.]|jgi:STE24 endopeptidase
MEILSWIILIVVITISLGRMVWVWNLNKIALNEYRRSNSAALALHKIERWNVLCQYIIIFTALLVLYLAFKLWEQTTLVINTLDMLSQFPIYASVNMKVFVLISVPAIFMLLYIIISFITDVVISHNTYNIIRNINQTLAESVFETVKETLIVISTVIVFLLFPLFIGHFIPLEWLFDWLFMENMLPELQGLFKWVLTIALRFLIPFFALIKIMDIVFPEILKLSSKATRIKDREIETYVSEIMCNHGNKIMQVYEFPSKKQKYANAIVVDDSKGRILISDYLIEHFTREELRAVLLHEIGHIKMQHLKKMAKSSLLPPYLKYVGWALFIGLSVVIIILPEDSIVSIILTYVMIIMSIFLIIGSIMDSSIGIFKTSRKHEKEADEYVIERGTEPQVYISALQKLYSLNDAPTFLVSSQFSYGI